MAMPERICAYRAHAQHREIYNQRLIKSPPRPDYQQKRHRISASSFLSMIDWLPYCSTSSSSIKIGGAMTLVVIVFFIQWARWFPGFWGLRHHGDVVDAEPAELKNRRRHLHQSPRIRALVPSCFLRIWNCLVRWTWRTSAFRDCRTVLGDEGRTLFCFFCYCWQKLNITSGRLRDAYEMDNIF